MRQSDFLKFIVGQFLNLTTSVVARSREKLDVATLVYSCICEVADYESAVKKSNIQNDGLDKYFFPFFQYIIRFFQF